MAKAERKPVIGLSWQPKRTLLSFVTKKSASLPDSVAVYKPNAELVDGLFVPPNNHKNLNKLLRKQLKETAGKDWFDMPALTITPELKKDIQLLKLRSVIDPKRHYKKGDTNSKTLPKYFQASRHSDRFGIILFHR
ncbi:RRNA-processing protein like [Actinidia chinensis var. chinensis]|uniref:rRNA-processing protein like n=1 Tax=Actinidia chinensis var. chinensis TaxID=1590841 RepID=A0A2R6PW13_ACTCC|nr:RRNA-processing protein like [Actinidia chinensis var. chinensis]